MNNELEKCIINLFDTINTKSREETTKMFKESIDCIKKSNIDIKNLENFNCFINHKLEKGIILLTDSLHEPSICKDKYKPNFIYKNYSFLENHIRQLCILKEGNSCCADKSRYILKTYLQYSITNEIPEFNPNIEKYYIPNFGDNKMWINYCDSLYDLYHGKTKDYFKCYNSLINSNIRTFEHILHRWYIEFNDGDTFEFDQTWDCETENPLKGVTDKGDFYLINKNKIKNKSFDIYEPKNLDEEFLFGDYVKIPKSKIKRIFKKSETKMI